MMSPKIVGGLLVLASVAAAGPTEAQEVEFFAHRGSSDLRELAEIEGLGLAGRFPLLEWLDVEVSLSSRSGTSASTEEVCTIWQPRWQCYEEPTSYETSLGEASAVLLPAVIRTDLLRLAVGGGMSLNKLHSKSSGESGRPIAVNMPSGAQRGFLAVADLTLSPGRRAPFAVIVAARLHRAELDGCIPEGDVPVVERFCGFYTFKELRAGVAFRF